MTTAEDGNSDLGSHDGGLRSKRRRPAGCACRRARCCHELCGLCIPIGKDRTNAALEIKTETMRSVILDERLAVRGAVMRQTKQVVFAEARGRGPKGPACEPFDGHVPSATRLSGLSLGVLTIGNHRPLAPQRPGSFHRAKLSLQLAHGMVRKAAPKNLRNRPPKENARRRLDRYVTSFRPFVCCAVISKQPCRVCFAPPFLGGDVSVRWQCRGSDKPAPQSCQPRIGLCRRNR